jgi:2-phosphosulfolactate phosphatase
VTNVYGQEQYQVRLDWGIQGADAIGDNADVIIVVDVLCFSTTVVLATALGVEVVPAAPEDAREIARKTDAVLGARRGEGSGLSLSPSSVTAESTSASGRIVIPSINGSRLVAALADQPALVVAGSLRNAAAIARWAVRQQGDKGDRFTVAVIAAGEVRADETLRFALEDYLGAGAIIDALAEVGIDYCSPEAAGAAAAFTGLRNATGHLIGASATGRELTADGFRADIDLAIDIDASETVPVLREFGFRAEGYDG